MKIRVSLFANLRQYAPEGEDGVFEIELDSGGTAGRLIETLEVPSTVQKVILVNGRHADEDTQLADGDAVTLFPTMEGG